MTTVKEFKDFGGEFIVGDEFEAVENKSPTAVTRKVAEIFNDGKFPNVAILSFAWRPLSTLPDNTNFKIEFKNSDSEFEKEMWRPLLDQSSVKPSDDKPVFTPWSETYSSDKLPKIKPVFTQAMADGGEKVKVGMLFATAAGNQEALMVSDKSVVFEVDGYLYAEVHEFIHPIDTRTLKQKAVDEMFHVAYPDKEPSGLLSRALEKLYDAGYRKC